MKSSMLVVLCVGLLCSQSAAQELPTLEAAIVAFNQGAYEQSVTLLNQLALDTNAEAQFYHGYALLRLERYSEALVHVESALQLRPDDVRAMYLRGVIRDALALPGARDDFERVAKALPESSIGQSSREFISAIDVAAQNETSSQVAVPVPIAEAELKPWQLRRALSVTLDYDSNPLFSPNSNIQSGLPAATPRGDGQLTNTATGSPATSLWTRIGFLRTFTKEMQLEGGIAFFERFYAPQTQPRSGVLMRPPRREAGRRRAGINTNTNTKKQGRSNDMTELAGDTSFAWQGLATDWRVGYRGALTLYGYSLYMHEHDLLLNTSWKLSDQWNLALRSTGYVLQPLQETYDHLRGWGASIKPAGSVLLFAETLRVEGGWNIEGYDAADYNDTSTGRFYSYSFLGNGPDLNMSYLAPHNIHLTLWGNVLIKHYLADDIDPYATGKRTIRRQDVRYSLSARAAWSFRPATDFFVEFNYFDNRSNLDASAHDDRNVRRFLGSIGVSWY